LGAGCAVAYWLYWELTIGHRRRELIKKHGCKPAPRVKTKDPVLGLDALLDIYRWSKQHTFLENLTKLLFGSGVRTVELSIFRDVTLFTTEAENIKAALSLKFKSFETGNKTKEIALLLGESIFTNDGEAWHQSRELIRPSFARSQLADLDMLEVHVESLIDKIPNDGSTIDLSKLFSQFTLSTGIGFLFGGADEGSSIAEDSTAAEAFTKVWENISRHLVDGGNREQFWLYWLNFILDRVRMNPQYKRDCQSIHGKSGMFAFDHLSLKALLFACF
jgi:cytochrome P450